MNSRLIVSVMVALVLGSALPASAWLARIDGGASEPDGATKVLADASGDVIAGGVLTSQSGEDGDPAVVKLAAADGSEIWRHAFDGTGPTSPVDGLLPSVDGLAVDSNDDVVVVGTLINTGLVFAEQQDLLVAKLDGATGAELWRRELDLGVGFGRDVSIDGSDDVLVVGRLGGCVVMKLDGTTGADVWSTATDDCTTGAATPTGDLVVGGNNPAFTVIRLDGATGGGLWTTSIDGPGSFGGEALSVTIDPSGDVVAAGYLYNGSLDDQLFTVAKFDGATGAELWELTTDGGYGDDLAWDVSAGADGAVYAFGTILVTSSDWNFTALKIDGTTGLELWRREIDGTQVLSHDSARAGIVDGAGVVWAGGWLQNQFSTLDGIVVRIDGSTSAEVWRSEIDGTAEPAKGAVSDSDRVLDVSLDPSGNPVAAGVLDQKGTGEDFLVMKLDPADGTTRSAAGQKLLVKDPGDPSKRRIVAVLKDDLIQTPPAGTVDDPTVAGATVRLRNPMTLEEATFTLPGGPDWKALGTPPGAKGYRYRDKSGTGPCQSLVMKPGKKAKVSCKASGGPIDFTLDEASQGSLVVSLQLGAAAPQCGLFGGLLIKDEVGQFKAKAAPADVGCP